jgi:hypothetical protein
MPGAIHGTQANFSNYVEWFVTNMKCTPTTLNTCELPSNIFTETKEMKELCGKYMPFPSISLPQEKTGWHRIFNFKTKLLLNDYLDLLEKIRHDERNLKDNLDRVQLIYLSILKEICFWSSDERIKIQLRANTIYLLTENNQWKPANTLHLYMEENAGNNNLKDFLPCLKLDFNNKNNSNLPKFLDLFNIKQIKTKDLKLVDQGSSDAVQFRTKLIEITPYLKNLLKARSFSLDVISSLDKIIQQQVHFIESDSLKLFYNGKFIQEINVYFDTIHQKFYTTRPWNDDITLINLPKHLCQLLNIQKCQDEFSFLLTKNKEKIITYFAKQSINLPTDKDTVSLKPLPKPGYIFLNHLFHYLHLIEIAEVIQLLTVSPTVSSDSASTMKDKKITVDKNVAESQIMETYIHQKENRQSIISTSIEIQRGCQGLSRHRLNSFHGKYFSN